jgi:hypothetical protein
MKDAVFTVRLNPSEAWALAQFLKRLNWEDVKLRTVDGNECELAMSAAEEVRKQLAFAGFAPR